MSVERTPALEIIDLINIYYDLDNTKEAGSPGSYWTGICLTDATSMARYGQRDWKGTVDIFYFDAVRLDAMTQHVGGYLLDYHKRARKMPHFGLFLDNMEIEPGDVIDITNPLDAMTNLILEVQKIQHHIGNKQQIDWLEITGIENGV